MGLPGQNEEPYCWSAMKLMKVSYSEELLSSGEASSTPRPSKRSWRVRAAGAPRWLARGSGWAPSAERAGLSLAASAELPMAARLRPEQARGPSVGGNPNTNPDPARGDEEDR